MTRSNSLRSAAVYLALILIAAYFVDWSVRFMRAEHTIYGWDFIGFWKFGAELAYRPDHSVFGAIAAFGRSFHHDYNDFCALPSACMMALWGPSRFCYVVANVVFLILPAVFVCLWLFMGLARDTWPQAIAVILAFLALVTAPLPWIVTFSGMTDVGGIIMAAVVTDLLMRTEIKCASATRWVAIGAGMAMLALCKRWYLYLVIGLLAILLVEIAYNFIKTCRKAHALNLALVIDAAFGPFLMICALVCVYFLSFPLPILILHTNYTGLYAAYQTGDTWPQACLNNLNLIAQAYGPLQIILATLCFIVGLCIGQARRAFIYLYVPAVFAWIDFSRMVTMNDHHMLLVFVGLLGTPIYLVRFLLSPAFRQGRPYGWTLLVLAVAVSSLNFGSVFSIAPPFGSSVVQDLFPMERRQPIQRHDLDEIEALLRFIGEKDDIAAVQPPLKNVYVLSSSLLFNSSHMATGAFQLNKPLPASDYIAQTADVDLRDGFPDALLDAQVVVVADPVQLHLHDEQKVITVPVRQFLQDEGFAQAFVRDSRVFQLDDGVRVYVFERTRPSTPEEIKDLRDKVGLPSKNEAMEPTELKL